MQDRTSSQVRRQKLAVIASELTLLLVLGACSGSGTSSDNQTDSTATGNAPASQPVAATAAVTTETRPSLSAAALSSDGTNSVNVAQAVAAGVLDPVNVSLVNATKPELGAAVDTSDVANETDTASNPLAVVPSESDTTTPAASNVAIASAPDQTDTPASNPTTATDAEPVGVDVASIAEPGNPGEPATATDSDSGSDNSSNTDTNTGTDTDTNASESPDSAAATAEPAAGNGLSQTVEPTTNPGTSTKPVNSGNGDSGTSTETASNSSTTGGDSSSANTGATSSNNGGSAPGDSNVRPAGSQPVEGDFGTEFSSVTTEGFNGRIMDDGTIELTWNKSDGARGYNVYRNAEYIESVFEERYVQTEVYDEDYYYEIQAFDPENNLNYIARGLTVRVRGTGKKSPNAPADNADILADYQLVWAEEFNGPELDYSIWNTEYIWGNEIAINSELQYYPDVKNRPDFGYNPFTFDGQNGIINAIRTPDELKSKSRNRDYLSGVMTTYDSFSFTYGYVEGRMKFTHGRGFWAAFWLNTKYYVDKKPEIDIMEFIGDDQDVAYHTYHWYDTDGELRSTKSKPTQGIDFTEDYHVFGLEWKPGEIIWYVDGVEVHRLTDPAVSSQEMYVIACLAVGGWWPGSPDASTPFPGEMNMDYIRVYQKNTPYSDVPLSDGVSKVPYADAAPGNTPSPGHRPPPSLWPAGYPDGT